MKIENLPAAATVPPEKEDATHSAIEEFMFELMMNEWRSRVLSSDGLTEEDNAEW
ncbi:MULTISPECIES: hypothetical protein [unclassified Pantoea]|uniref:hypothetical protein n=1 Tax=unclassified Pantoea TaxID=2630326 RepID=UPI0013140CFD|nr:MULTISPECIES: hypothetical protein [unclassified Pantoea]